MNQSPVRILQVDDDPAFGDLTATFLERENDRFVVETVASAAEGLDSLRDRPPDCIVSDYDMPGQNGIEFLRSVRDEWSELPFILFTGKGSEEIASEAISAGVTDYLQKGSGTDRYELLVNRIENAVQARRSADQLDRQEELMRLTEIAGNTGGWELDLDTDEMQITAGTGRLTGLSQNGTLSLEDGIDLYHPDDREKVRAAVDRAARANEQVQGTWRIQPADGDQRIVDVTIIPVVSDGEVTTLRGAINDVSEHVYRQQQLEQTRERMEYALEATDSKIFEIDPQTDEETRYGPFERLYGVSQEAVPTTETFLTEAIHPADRQRLEQTITDAVERAPTTAELEYRTNPEHGDVRWLHGRLSGKTDETGDVTNLVGLSTDVTARKRRERKLRQYRTLLESINDAVFVVDSDQTIVYANDRSLADVDLTPEQVAGNPVVPFVEEFATDDTEIDAFEQALETALADHGEDHPDSVELTLRVDGSRAVFEYEFSRIPTEDPITGASGTDAAVAVVARELTDRVERVAELRRTREVLTEMERIADIGAWEYDPDTGEVINTTGARRIYGLGPDADLTTQEAFGFYHRADRDRLRELFDECVASGEAYETDVQLTAADGEQKWVTARGERVETHSGRQVVRGYIQDVTAKKERFARLEQIETLFENAQDMLFIIEYTGEEFVVVRVNSAFECATGLSNEQLQGKTPQELFGPEQGQQVEQRYRHCLSVDEPLSYEKVLEEQTLPGVEAPDAGGNTYWEAQIAPVETGGDEEWIVGTARDINERKRRERELERQNERLEEFASIVSHDLRTPLGVANGHLELAREERSSSHLEAAASALTRMDGLIEDLLTLAQTRYEATELRPVSVAEVAGDCWETVPTAAVELTIDLTQTIRAERGQLKRLFENLFMNAVEHGSRDGTVTVGQVDGGFYIADEGPGIPAEERSEIFTAGYSTADDGTGFGLQIVENVVATHGWDIHVTDSDTGGARFEITGVDTVE